MEELQRILASHDEFFRIRYRKLQELKEMGYDPQAAHFKPTHSSTAVFDEAGSLSAEELEARKIRVAVAGRVIAMRQFGKASFFHLLDGTGKIQGFIEIRTAGEDAFKAFKKIDIGDIIGVEGYLFRTRTGELTVNTEHFYLLTKSLRPLPEKWHGLQDVEIRYRQRYLDLIANPEVREIFRKRSRIIAYIRHFFQDRQFLEVDTPTMQVIPGGAAAKPFVTYHNVLDMNLYLRIAPELYLKRLLVGGFERVFEIGKNFRNEGVSSVHNPEFTMMEFYMAYSDYNDLMNMTEELLSSLVKELYNSYTFEYQGIEIDVTPPFKRITFLESLTSIGGVDSEIVNSRERALKLAREMGAKLRDDSPHGKVLEEIFERTVQPHLQNPTFVVDFPVDISPLAKRKPDNPELVERFELYLAGLEVANAFSELNDPIDQRLRFEEQAKLRSSGDDEAHAFDEDFITALEYGMPPAAGEGIGIDRLVMILTDSRSIREVILFPHLRKRPQE